MTWTCFIYFEAYGHVIRDMNEELALCSSPTILHLFSLPNTPLMSVISESRRFLRTITPDRGGVCVDPQAIRTKWRAHPHARARDSQRSKQQIVKLRWRTNPDPCARAGIHLRLSVINVQVATDVTLLRKHAADITEHRDYFIIKIFY